jgi:putative Ca2+/H+ antiporter (TMEM165/GDT1 family)
MDWRLAASAFGAILVAEMGDKTQIAALALAAGHSSRLAVFLGAALALVAATAIAVLVGDGLARLVPPLLLRRLAGAVFVGLGLLYLVQKGG